MNRAAGLPPAVEVLLNAAPDGTGGLPIPNLSRCAAEGLADVLQRGAGVPDDDEVLLHPDAIVILHPAEGGDLLDAEITDIRFTWTTPTGDTIYSQRHGISTR